MYHRQFDEADFFLPENDKYTCDEFDYNHILERENNVGSHYQPIIDTTSHKGSGGAKRSHQRQLMPA